MRRKLIGPIHALSSASWRETDRGRWLISTLGILALSLALPTSAALAAVTAEDDVLPADNIFTPGVEGLPTNGNFLDINRVTINPMTGEITGYLPQITYEGRPNAAGNANVNEQVLVGTESAGQLYINSGSKLRFLDLIIGDSDTTTDPMLPMYGFGYVEISGPGSLYNNDYTIIPPTVPAALLADVPDISVNPRSAEPEAAEGFDLIVGNGSGSVGILSISAGGRAEIHDSIMVGRGAGSSGTILVDGPGTLLRGGGCLDCSTPTEDDTRITSIGIYGTGQMQILNGATVLSEGYEDGTASTGLPLLGASIGTVPITATGVDLASPASAGNGSVIVEGNTSQWVIGFGLQIGGFSNAMDDLTGSNPRDIEGNNARYGTNTGIGSLQILDGALVSIISPPNAMLTNEQTNLLIGFESTLEFGTGGQLSVGTAGQRDDNVIMMNDGNILGDGRMDVGIFRNRYYGTIDVRTDEKLHLHSTEGFDSNNLTVPPPLDELPLLNWGVINVYEGEFEVSRGEDAGGEEGADPNDPIRFQMFQNRAIPIGSPTPLSRAVGQIKSYDSTLTFGTGLSNQGLLEFYGGDNIVLGDVVNEALTATFPEGVIQLTGYETNVTFNGNFINNGLLMVGPNAFAPEVSGMFTNTGSIVLSISNVNSETTLGNIAVGGDGMLGGELSVSLNGVTGLMAGDTFQVVTSGGELTSSSLFGFDSFDLPFLGTTLGWFPLFDTMADTFSLLVLDASLAMGPDLDGSGFVDAMDLGIWLANAGSPGGLGDVNMDGVVDGLDLIQIQINFGMPFPGAGSGSGGEVVVPEPASAVLLVTLLVASLPFYRRRWA